MASYSIRYEHRVKKDLKQLDKPAVKRVVAVIDKLAVKPYPANSKKLVSSDFRSLRVGGYRVIYTVKEEMITVLVLRIGHRKNVYRF